MAREIKPLYNFEPEPEEEKPEIPDKKDFMLESADDGLEHEFYLVDHYKRVKSVLPVIQHGVSYSLMSFGDWSLRHLIFHIAKLIEPCDAISTTYGLGTGSARGIVNALKRNVFTSFKFIYDKKVLEYKAEAHHLCASTFPVKVTSIHAKITTLINADFAVLVVGSANWSDTNNKIEFTEIIVSRKKAEFYRDVLEASIRTDALIPKEIINVLKDELPLYFRNIATDNG